MAERGGGELTSEMQREKERERRRLRDRERRQNMSQEQRERHLARRRRNYQLRRLRSQNNANRNTSPVDQKLIATPSSSPAATFPALNLFPSSSSKLQGGRNLRKFPRRLRLSEIKHLARRLHSDRGNRIGSTPSTPTKRLSMVNNIWRNWFERGESSSFSSPALRNLVDEQQLYQPPWIQQGTPVAYNNNNNNNNNGESDITFEAFRNLSLNDRLYYRPETNPPRYLNNPAAEYFPAGRNSGNERCTSYNPPEANRPRTLNTAAAEYSPARNGGNERRTNSNYYHNTERQSIRPPPYTMYPNNFCYQQPGMRTPPKEDMLNRPYEYMINPGTDEYLKLLSHDTLFIDLFVVALTSNKDYLVATACHCIGSRMLQLLIKLGKRRAVMGRVPQILADDLELLMKNQSGMHVIRQCFTELEEVKYMPLFNKLIENDNWFTIALNQIGCRGLNNCISYMVDDLKTCIISRVAEFAVHLALDVYGNYVVQHVIDLGTIYTHDIVQKLVPHVQNLCEIKSGSHLLEKCLKTSCWAEIVQQLVKSNNKLPRLANHESANYVIQKAIARSKIGCPELYQKLVDELRKKRDSLERNKFGQHVLKWLPEADK